jgi:TPP-dependent pyruvate/acetoin dehydrogenase alpha subunit
MYLTRRFDETAEELNRQHRSIGSIHTGVGEEAMSVGVTSVLRDSDVISSSYRDVGVFFARGITTLEVAGLLFGKKNAAKSRLNPGFFTQAIWTVACFPPIRF